MAAKKTAKKNTQTRKPSKRKRATQSSVKRSAKVKTSRKFSWDGVTPKEIEAWRKKNGYTLRQAASELEISVSTYQNWTHGRAVATRKRQEKVKQALQKSKPKAAVKRTPKKSATKLPQPKIAAPKKPTTEKPKLKQESIEVERQRATSQMMIAYLEHQSGSVALSDFAEAVSEVYRGLGG